jgi:hypothetical protein
VRLDAAVKSPLPWSTIRGLASAACCCAIDHPCPRRRAQGTPRGGSA